MTRNKSESMNIISCPPGWELVTVVFEGRVDHPEISRSPLIAWDVTDVSVFPVMPWARFVEPVDMETEYNAFICPDGVVVGGVHMRRFEDLPSFVEACKEAECMAREMIIE